MKTLITVVLIACSLSLYAETISPIGLHLDNPTASNSNSPLAILNGVSLVPSFQLQDTVPETVQDTVPETVQDTVPETVQDAAPEAVQDAAPEAESKKKDKKKKDEFKVYAGVNFNSLSVSSDVYSSATELGYLIGFKYKRGKFFYWEVGAQFNKNNNYLEPKGDQPPPEGFDGILKVSQFDIPINVGINFLSVTSRIVGLRVYAGVSPSFITGIKDNQLGLTKDDLNSFNMYAHAGIGVDVTFLFLEFQYDFGFSDMIKNDVESKPSQLAITLGFRF